MPLLNTAFLGRCACAQVLWLLLLCSVPVYSNYTLDFTRVDEVEDMRLIEGDDIVLDLPEVKCEASDIFWTKRYKVGIINMLSFDENGTLFYMNHQPRAYGNRVVKNATRATILNATAEDSGVYLITIFCYSGKRFRFFKLVMVYERATPPEITTVAVYATPSMCNVMISCKPPRSDYPYVTWFAGAVAESWEIKYSYDDNDSSIEYLEASTTTPYDTDARVACRSSGEFDHAFTNVSLTDLCSAKLRETTMTLVAALVPCLIIMLLCVVYVLCSRRVRACVRGLVCGVDDAEAPLIG